MDASTDPMQPEEPDEHGDRSDPADDLGVAVDPTDPLKRGGGDDMPGLDTATPPLPTD